VLAYLIALITPESIFELAVRFAFSGFAAMAPVMVAALFWRRSTKYGALASTLWVAAWLVLIWHLQDVSSGLVPKPGQPPAVIYAALGHLFERTGANVTVYGFLPVVPMVLGSALCMIVFSLLTPPPAQTTIDRYFPPRATPEPTQHLPASDASRRSTEPSYSNALRFQPHTEHN
jgi:solute:Na+ symporter, SSS family